MAVMLYKKIGETVSNKTFHDEEEMIAAYKDGWVDNPTDAEEGKKQKPPAKAKAEADAD